MTNFQILKGTKDYEPKEAIQINFILDIIIKNFKRFGFRPFQTPIIELINTLTFKYDIDAEITSEIFKLNDRGKRQLGLRYDLTTPLLRYISSKKQLKLPFKRYQIGQVFRDGPIKKGRLREFMQCDADVIGIKNIEIELELLNLFSVTFKEIGINSIIELNNNKILQGALLQNGFKKNELSDIILSIDKLKKIGVANVLKEIELKGFDIQKVKTSIEILNSKSLSEIKNIAINETLKKGIKELEELIILIDNLDYNIEYRLNFSMARGLDIYTGNIWEVYDKDNFINSSLGAGGRYDNIINEFNNSLNLPAVGISFGLVPIIEVLNLKSKNLERNSLIDILIIPLKEDFFIDALNLANNYRKNGLNIDIDLNYKLKKAFQYADYLGIKKIIVLGDKDINNNSFKLKDLTTGKENEIKFKFTIKNDSKK